MLKFQPPMLNDEAHSKQTHTHIHQKNKKHTYRVKTEETFY